MIKQLSQVTAEDLCAQQVITSLPDCVKELIDNSIDAKATSIRVILTEYGKKQIEVIDNGEGIANFNLIGKKGSSSKHRVSNEVESLGFRGEAIHSIGKVSGSMQIESVRGGIGRRLDVKTGEVKEEANSTSSFTRVCIEEIFAELPVRRNELIVRCKEWLKQVNESVREYCLAYPEVQFLLINVVDGRQQVSLETVAHKTWAARVAEMFPEKVSSSLVQLSTPLLEGFVLGRIESGSSHLNTFLKKSVECTLVNRRPVNPIPQVSEALSEIYKKYNKTAKHLFILNFKIALRSYDVNLTPNKREVFIRKAVLDQLCAHIKSEILSKVGQDVPKLESFQLQKYTQSSQQTYSQQPKAKQSEQPLHLSQSGSTEKPSIRISAPSIRISAPSIRMSAPYVRNDLPKIKGAEQEMKESAQSMRQKIQARISSGGIRGVEEKERRGGEEKERQESQQKGELRELLASIDRCGDHVAGDRVKSIVKENFREFEVLGQFNKGFILCRFSGRFYLIDQHAASEKDNYETILATTFPRISCFEQRQLTLIESDQVEGQREPLESAGYIFTIQNKSILQLKRCPMFYDKKLGLDTFLEMVETEKPFCSLKSVVHLAASKACRMAVMVGDVLSKRQMESLCGRLSELDSPWNCPHGRPAVIELGQTEMFRAKAGQDRRYEL